MIKKLIVILTSCFAAGLLFLIAFCRPKPDGGVYWTFIAYAPVIVAGDGSSFKTAYLLKKGQAGGLATVECGLIHEKFGVYDDKMVFTDAILNDRFYHVISFPWLSGTNSVYFDVTAYRKEE